MVKAGWAILTSGEVSSAQAAFKLCVVVVVHVCDLRTKETEARQSIKSQPGLHGDFEANLNYIMSHPTLLHPPPQNKHFRKKFTMDLSPKLSL